MGSGGSARPVATASKSRMLSPFSFPILLLVSLLLPNHLLARPNGDELLGSVNSEGTEDYEGSSWINIISKLAGVALRAGEAVADVVQKEGALNESFGGNYTQVVKDSVQELLLLVPQIKSNISDAIAMVPEVKSQLKEKLNELPTQEELQKKADNFIAQLPNYKKTVDNFIAQLPNYKVVEELGSSVKEGLASLPTKEEVAEGVDSAFEMIPEADEVHSNIDTAVNAISPIFERENEVAAAADVS